MNRFAHFLAVDWSGAAGPVQKGIALALCDAHPHDSVPRLIAPCDGRAHWSREGVLDFLRHRLPADTLVGLDLGISLPFADAGAFFPGWAGSPVDARSLWALVEGTCAHEANLGVSAFVDHALFSQWFRRHGGREGTHFLLPGAADRRGRMRVSELAQAHAGCRPTSNFNLVGAAQVGKSSLSGMRMLHRLSDALPVWPIDPAGPQGHGSVVCEIYTTMAAIAAGRRAGNAKIRDTGGLNAALAALGVSGTWVQNAALDDHRTDALVTAAWLRQVANDAALWAPVPMTGPIARTEGWTFGAR